MWPFHSLAAICVCRSLPSPLIASFLSVVLYYCHIIAIVIITLKYWEVVSYCVSLLCKARQVGCILSLRVHSWGLREDLTVIFTPKRPGRKWQKWTPLDRAGLAAHPGSCWNQLIQQSISPL